MAKDGTARGGARPGSGRKRKPLAYKINGGQAAVVMGLPAAWLCGADMPQPKDYPRDRQKNGGGFAAEEIYTENLRSGSEMAVTARKRQNLRSGSEMAVTARKRQNLRSGSEMIMAFIQYLTLDGTALPLPDSYEVRMDDVEADSGGETEAGTTRGDVARLGVVSIPVTFSVSAKCLKLLTGFKQQDKISVDYFDTQTLSAKNTEMYIDGFNASLVKDMVKDTSANGL